MKTACFVLIKYTIGLLFKIGDEFMIKLLIKRFVSNYDNINDKKVRESYGVLAGILGIICNIFLFGVKISIGLLMNSIAIISDAFNNLSDTGSSLITIIGTKLSNRKPDKEHPFGHGRIEYISSLIVSFIIFIVGFELLKNSFDKIIHPQPVEFSVVLIVILSISILVKLWMFSYNKYLGDTVNLSVLKATASDSLNDVIATSAIIVSTIIGYFIAFPIDGVAGLIVSFVIMYTGFGIAKDTIDMLLGTPPSRELVKDINDIIISGDGIIGVHDLIVHDYGPGRVMASAHAEVPDDIDIIKIHEVIDATEQKIQHELGINIVIHMDPISINCKETDDTRNLVMNIVKEINPKFSIHDFRLTSGQNHINLIFDLVVPLEVDEYERNLSVNLISEKLSNIDNRYNTVIQIDNYF
jgi:cation diffusion facilitator family transporter